MKEPFSHPLLLKMLILFSNFDKHRDNNDKGNNGTSYIITLRVGKFCPRKVKRPFERGICDVLPMVINNSARILK